MTIIKLLYFKYILSFFICLFSSFVIFFVFSLLGNLNESYYFKTIINLSFLNSLQIISYVPAFIFLITVVLFIIFLKSKNEITIIKSYVSIKKLFLFFIPIILIFSVFEISKNNLTGFFENSKSNLLEQQDKLVSKILVSENKNSKTYTVLKNVGAENAEDIEYRSYLISNKKIELAEFSNNLSRFNNSLITYDYTQYKKNVIENIDNQKIIDINLLNFEKQNSIVNKITLKSNLNFNLRIINVFIFFLLFFNYVFLIFLNRKFVNSKESLTRPTLICLSILLYSFFIFNNSLSEHKQLYEILASVIIGILILREGLNE